MAVDESVERMGRWAAGRLSRRGFLGTLGRAGIMVAGGSAMAALLSDIAEARVCGQSGVSPLCPDFDCNETMGWCWYAVGCCAGGKLKKICDCCAPVNNVHGYCPAGTNVYCVFESCGTDPRVQTTPVTRFASDDPATVARLVRASRFPHGASTVVLCDDTDAAVLAMATALAGVLRAPVLHQRPGPLSAANRTVISGLRAVSAKVVGPSLPSSVDATLVGDGLAVERIGASAEMDVLSAEVGQWIAQHYAVTSVVGVAAGAPRWVLGLTAAFAASQGTALLLGEHAAVAVERPVLAAGPGAAGLVALVAGSRRIEGDTPRSLAAALAAATPTPLQHFTMAPDSNGTLLELAALGLPIVLHERGGLRGSEAVLARRSAEVPGRVYLAGVSGSLASPAFRRLQSDLNGYAIHLLTGVAGQGLPVISQPLAERPVGLARPGDSPPPPEPPPPSWLGWGA